MFNTIFKFHQLCLIVFLGVMTLTLTNPIWVVKTRLCLVSTEAVPLHMQYRGLGEGLVNLYRYEGLRGMYKVRYL